MEHGNATAAYKAAGYPEHPAASTWVLAFRVLRKPAVQQLIHDLRQEAVDAARVNVNRIVQGLARIAFADRTDLFDDKGRLLPKSLWPADVKATVEEIENLELFEVTSEKGALKRKELVGFTRKVKTARRIEALKLLMQWLRMVGPDADTGKALPGSEPKNSAVIEIELGPENVLPPTDTVGE